MTGLQAALDNTSAIPMRGQEENYYDHQRPATLAVSHPHEGSGKGPPG